MRKIPTLFARDPDDMRHVARQVNPAAAWVLDGHGHWWARREVKQGKPFPPSYIAEETDPNTGKTVGWEPIDQSPFAKAWREVMNDFRIDKDDLTPGTYELCGPKVNGNPEGFDRHQLIPHGQHVLDGVPRDYDELAAFLKDFPHEGIVWHHPDGRAAKLKRRDFT